MASGKNNKKTIKIISATLMCIFSLFITFTGTIAWFTAVRETNNNVDDFGVKDLGEHVNNIEFHAFEGEITQNGNTYYTFSTSPSGSVSIVDGVATQTGSMNMGTFSIDNPHHPILILFELKDSGEINFGASTNSNYMASNSYTLQASNNPLSSIVEFYRFTYSSTSSDATSLSSRTINVGGTNYYSLKTNEFVRGTNSISFPEINNNGDYTGNFRSEIVLYNGVSNGLSYVGIVIDYYQESLEYVYSYYLGHPLLNDGLSFSCDWEMLL